MRWGLLILELGWPLSFPNKQQEASEKHSSSQRFCPFRQWTSSEFATGKGTCCRIPASCRPFLPPKSAAVNLSKRKKKKNSLTVSAWQIRYLGLGEEQFFQSIGLSIASVTGEAANREAGQSRYETKFIPSLWFPSAEASQKHRERDEGGRRAQPCSWLKL